MPMKRQGASPESGMPFGVKLVDGVLVSANYHGYLEGQQGMVYTCRGIDCG